MTYMTRPAQKQQERDYLKHFLKNKFASTKYSVFKDDSEKPDFIIHLNNKKIGIELTNLYKGDGSNSYSERSKIAKRIDVINRAQKIYLKSESKNFEYNFNFDLNFPISNNKKISKKLAVSLEKTMKIANLPNLFGLEDCEEIKSVYCNFEEYEQPKWKLAQVYDVPNIDINNLLFVVDQKKSKLDSYEICDEQWLLIIIEFWDPAQDQQFSLEGKEFVASPFDKIFIYKPATLDLMEYV